MKKYGFGYSIISKRTVIAVGVSPVNIVAPSLTRVGNSIVCNRGSWTGTEPINYSFVFIVSLDGGVNFSVVQSSASDTYNLAIGDNLGIIRCNVNGNNGISPIGFAASNDISIGQLMPVNIVAPAISGNRFVSQTLSGTDGTWTNASTYSYQWQRSTDGGGTWSDISGATSATYVSAVADMANRIRRRVRATNSFGNTDAFSGNIQIVYTVLDGYSNIAYAADLRLQRGAYYGNNLVEIWRTVDNATLNIGHDSDGNINIAAAIAHAGGVNRIIQSQTFSNASWSKINSSIVATNGLAPDNTNTASTLELAGQYGVLQQTEPNSLIPSTSVVDPTGIYCVYFHVKKVNRNILRIISGTGNTYAFNFDAPAANPAIGANFEALANGWFRIWVICTGAQMTYVRLQGHDNSAAGDQFLIWGAGINKGATPATYVPTTTGPSGFAKVRINYDQSTNARHATQSQYRNADFIVVDGAAIIEEGQISMERYESTHGLEGGYIHTSYSAGANTTIYDKHRRVTGNYTPSMMNMHYIHNGGGMGFNEPTSYNASIAVSTVYSVNIWNRATPNGRCFRRIMSNSNWETGTLLTNLSSTNPSWNNVRGEFYNTWGRYRLRATIIFTASHDLSTMQAISLLI